MNTSFDSGMGCGMSFLVSYRFLWGLCAEGRDTCCSGEDCFIDIKEHEDGKHSKQHSENDHKGHKDDADGCHFVY